MAESTLIIAESGSGKSTSIRNLNPEETFYNLESKDFDLNSNKKDIEKEIDRFINTNDFGD